jgi:hypothetical protein
VHGRRKRAATAHLVYSGGPLLTSACGSYCGYHDAVGKVCYAVMPYPSCSGCLGGSSAFEALTGTSSQELCEAITDPAPGSGWYDSQNGEIGDICAWRFKRLLSRTSL